MIFHKLFSLPFTEGRRRLRPGQLWEYHERQLRQSEVVRTERRGSF